MATQAQIAAYRKAHKKQDMAGMFAAAGGDPSKLSGLHRAAKVKATTESRGRLQMEKAAPPKAVPPKKKAVTAPAVESRGRLQGGAVASRGRLQGGAAKSRSAPKAGTSTAEASRRRLQASGRGTAALAGPKPSISAANFGYRLGPGAGKAVGVNIKQLGKTIQAGGKAYRSAMDRSDKAIIAGTKKALKATKKWGRRKAVEGFTF